MKKIYSEYLRDFENVCRDASNFCFDEEQFMSSNSREVAEEHQKAICDALGNLTASWVTTPKFFGARDHESNLTKAKKLYLQLGKVRDGSWKI